MLTSILDEVTQSNYLELNIINLKFSDIKAKLLFQDYIKLECCKLMLGKRLTSLENINDECYWYIRELQDKVTRNNKVKLKDDKCKNQNVTSIEIKNRRNKMFHQIEKMLDLSEESIKDREIEEMEDDFLSIVKQ